MPFSATHRAPPRAAACFTGRPGWVPVQGHGGLFVRGDRWDGSPGLIPVTALAGGFLGVDGGDGFSTPYGTRVEEADVGPVGALTTIVGDYTVAAGETLTNKYVTGSVYLSGSNSGANNVMSGGSFNVNMAPGGNYSTPPVDNITLNRVKGKGFYSLGGTNVTMSNFDFGDVSDTIGVVSDFLAARPVQNWVLKDGWFRKFLASNGSGGHYEALHVFGCTNLTLQNVRLDFDPPDTTTFNQTTAVENTGDGNGTSTHSTGQKRLGCFYSGGSYYVIYFETWGSSNEIRWTYFNYDPAALRKPQVQYGPVASGVAFAQSNNFDQGSPITLATNA